MSSRPFLFRRHRACCRVSGKLCYGTNFRITQKKMKQFFKRGGGCLLPLICRHATEKGGLVEGIISARAAAAAT